ncbi:MAG TPA: hypothetical protein ENK04_06505 [Gammaproteobacteria bacterium]|nr:hypothetical protein [Gammaproteobacteria bacterium]
MSEHASLKPWATRPFELIVHGEIHFRRGADYDRRLALVSFDNSIEVTIAAYLKLNPAHRGYRSYSVAGVANWLRNFHTRVDFFLDENKNRGLPEYKTKEEIVWYHDQRNEHYHGGGAAVPEQSTLEGVRQSALWIFSVLFEVPNIEQILEEELAKREVATSIPGDLAVPEQPDTAVRSYSPAQAKAMAVATLLGQWKEGKEADLDIARRIVDEF